ncbi:hypothetical protein BDB00DRAFT_787227 [Zychaea mexicana]|uniref:uncharacterized protein n=1 Tax=Zychaea mexicana TaxID=64656 RepID=UPI0022FEEDEC|nr:uncharacterized protein BDB00DRAFT_787227 [Zychaea mexicana]KAI9494389.1 hypothetical protein BDB00DRAFT_787227 [Zychaea mexicana]
MSEGISRNGGSNNNNNNLGNAASGGNFNIRGLSGGGGGGISIRGESGPGIVVISNLDPGANAEDVKTACQQFGPVVRCDVMVDHAGRSFGEAEVEFGTKAAALDCVSKLDNEVADGRVLRAVLRSRPGPQPMVSSPSQQQQHGVPAGPASFASQTLRSVIAPTRSGYTSAASGKMYSDQLMGAAAQPAPQQQLPPHQHHSDYARYQSAPTRRY